MIIINVCYQSTFFIDNAGPNSITHFFSTNTRTQHIMQNILKMLLLVIHNSAEHKEQVLDIVIKLDVSIDCKHVSPIGKFPFH